MMNPFTALGGHQIKYLLDGEQSLSLFSLSRATYPNGSGMNCVPRSNILSFSGSRMRLTISVSVFFPPWMICSTASSHFFLSMLRSIFPSGSGKELSISIVFISVIPSYLNPPWSTHWRIEETIGFLVIYESLLIRVVV